MSRSAVWKWGALSAIVLMVLGTAFAFHPIASAAAPAAKSPQRVTISGHKVPGLNGASQAASGASALGTLNLSIGLSLRNQDQLKNLILAQNTRGSGLYHQYLTPQQFTQRFGPTDATVSAVRSFLQSQGITVDSVASNHLLIDVHGSATQVEKAFAVNLGQFRYQGRTVFAPTTEPSVPGTLAGTITAIAGLDNVAVYHHHATLMQPQAGKPAQHPSLGPGGGYTPSELRTAYDMNSLISSANGAGQTVAIFELDGYKTTDVNTYLSNYGLGSANYSNVLVDGATNTAGAGAIEVELDMEVVSAIAPGAAQKIYIGPNTTAGVNDTYNRIVTDNVAKVSSTSWGLCEASSGTSELQSLNNIFTQAAAQGQAIYSASGDSGAYDCNNTSLAVDSPSDDPNVVGVGGTNLQTGTGGTYTSESVWSCTTCTQRSAKGSGGGGGLSTFFAKPSYQTGPGVSNSFSNGKRQLPDVSADADPNSGYSIYCTVTASGCSATSGWTSVGGTSAAAPLWAGLSADVNQYLIAQSKPTLGSASASLYALFNTAQTFSAYHDVTSGNNLFYPATSGYDQASGIGTPDVWNIARDLAGASGGGSPPTVTSFSPTSGAVGTGVTLTGTNFTGATAVKFNGTSATFTVVSSTSISATVPTGATTGTISVTNTAGTGTSATSFTVTTTGGSGVTNPGFETGTFSGWTASGAATSISTTAHSGSFAGQAGSTAATNGDSNIAQTFTVPAGTATLSFWYKVVCPDTVTYDWATATLKDNTTSTTTTMLAKTCTNTGAWVQVTANVTAGDSVTLTLTSHDDNYAGDPTYTLFDDVALGAAVSNPVTNPGFETGTFSGWTVSGAATSISSSGHTGSFAGQAGSTAATNGDSNIAQTFTIPTGSSHVTFWYKVVCPDTVTYDWATATLKDNTTSTTTTVLAKTCTNSGTWVQVSASATAGHSVTLTLTSHDDNYAGDPTYTLFDDVNVS
ncbi:MAG: peptidase S53 [Ktedonobacterales bacterium]|nr:peptidase S53 [Ktedonobacterales bacterium]